jgi:hypothetical protein
LWQSLLHVGNIRLTDWGLWHAVVRWHRLTAGKMAICLKVETPEQETPEQETPEQETSEQETSEQESAHWKCCFASSAAALRHCHYFATRKQQRVLELGTCMAAHNESGAVTVKL